MNLKQTDTLCARANNSEKRCKCLMPVSSKKSPKLKEGKTFKLRTAFANGLQIQTDKQPGKLIHLLSGNLSV